MSSNDVCPKCGANLIPDTLNEDQLVCPYCGKTVQAYNENHRFEKYKMHFNETVRRRKVEEARKNDIRIFLKDHSSTVIIVSVGLLLLIFFFSMIYFFSPDQQLNRLIAKVNQDIEQGDLNQAMIDVQKIQYTELDFAERRKWADVKNEMIKIINEKKKEQQQSDPDQKPWYQFW